MGSAEVVVCPNAYPSKSDEETCIAEITERTLTNEGVKYVRLAFVDISNILRFRIVPVPRFASFLKSGTSTRGVCLATACMGLLSPDDHLVEGLPERSINVCSELCLVPDVKSLRKLPYGSGAHAICMGDFEQKDCVELQRQQFEGCPRTSLKNLLRRAEGLGLSFLVGFESEVTFLKSTDPPIPLDTATYCTSKAFHSADVCQMVDEMVEAITSQGIEVLQFHKESGPGQYEFVTAPYGPLEAADALTLTRESIFNIAAKYGLRATFAPKVFLDSVGTGAHCHISVKGGPEFDNLEKSSNGLEGMTGLEAHFMAGILKHMRALSAFTLPHVNSHDRLQENYWAGVHVVWGTDNREATLRLAYAPKPHLKDREFNFEIKCVDGTANPYLAVAAIITAGLDGIQNKLPLGQPDLRASPSSLTKDERHGMGITERLPSSVEEALDALKGDYDLFSDSMGKTMVDIFITKCLAESDYLKKLSKSEQIKLVIQTY